jgi:hypothetical protein
MGKLLAMAFLAPAVILSYAAADNAQWPKATVGVLTPGLSYEPAFTGLREGLEKLGYRENREIRFIIEDTQGTLDRLTERAARLVAAKPALLFTVATAPLGGRPASGTNAPYRIYNCRRSGANWPGRWVPLVQNNVAGVVTFSAQLCGKRLEVPKEIAPRTKKVLSIVPVTEPIGLVAFKFLETAAKKGRAANRSQKHQQQRRI